MTPRRAAFLDRDGTIIEDTGFVRDPEGVSLIPGSANAIRRLNESGWIVVMVTNQSGIARGLLTEADYQAVQARLVRLLAEQGARIDASYLCPHHPEVSGPCDCRKPGLKHYRDAAGRFEIDFARSLFVGDRMSDLEPARVLGGTGVLVLTGEGRKAKGEAEMAGFPTASDLLAATALSIDD